jgi:hypothetical protein
VSILSTPILITQLLLCDIDTQKEPTQEEVTAPLKKELRGKIFRMFLLESIREMSDEEVIERFFEN